MYLEKKYIGKAFEFNIEFEAITSNMFIVSINKKKQNKGCVLSYWRLTAYDDKAIPPLEIGVNYIEQSIDSLTFFVAKGMIEKMPIKELALTEGCVLVNTTIFTKQFDFVDNSEEYYFGLQNNKLVVYWDNIDDLCTAYCNERVEFYVNKNNYIVGFAISCLSNDELNIINQYI